MEILISSNRVTEDSTRKFQASDGHVTQGTSRNLTGVNGMGRVLQVRLFFADEHFSVTVEAPPQTHRVNATYIISCLADKKLQ